MADSSGNIPISIYPSPVADSMLLVFPVIQKESGGAYLVYCRHRVIAQKLWVPDEGCVEWLEPDEEQLSCPVLRGRRRSNALLLLPDVKVVKWLN